MRLLLVHSPRSLILASDDYCLIFKQPPLVPAKATAPAVVVEFLSTPEANLDSASILNERIFGTLGVLHIAGETFLPIVTSSTSLGSHSFTGIGAEPIDRILAVEFYCLTSNAYDAYPPSALDYDNYDTDFSSAATNLTRAAGLGGTEPMEHPCAGIRKILSASSFYYSSGEEAFDLSTRLEERVARAKRAPTEIEGEEKEEEVEDRDGRFLWNTFLVSPLLAFRTSLAPTTRKIFDQEGFVVRAIQGYCGVSDIMLGGQPAVLSLISRLGWENYGTRFNSRGIDDDGNVANFVETETILRTADMCVSYVQLRGSIPIFWEEGPQPFGKIIVTRPIEASLPAFLRHFESLLSHYPALHLINLLSAKDQEALLTDAYLAHLRSAKVVDTDIRDRVEITQFDFHARSRVGGIESVKSQLAGAVGSIGEGFGAGIFSVDARGEGTIVMGQRGVFRTNCKDCLDRTNVVEDTLSRFALEDFIRNTNPGWTSSDASLWGAHRILWAENGDALSRAYVGTNAINSSFTRSGKNSFAGLISNAKKSVGRMYQSNFVDQGKQQAIDALLGHLSHSQKVRVFNPVNDAIRETLKTRSDEFTSYESITIWVGTYNLNGQGPTSESLLPWLFPTSGEPSILVIAFQEIVPLSLGQIMATDPEKKRRWEAHILKTVSERPGKKADYVLLRSGQLVGTALLVLVQTALVHDIRNVQVATKKTGLRGMSGNKGAVAIRLDYRDTSFCFLTAHLAAGHSNVEERNADYHTIAGPDGLHFSKGKTIASHDNVVWASDTNYRISLPNEDIRRLVDEDDFGSLIAADQLLMAMKTKHAFVGYVEGPLLFRPTYKYDNGTEIYDSSEKNRAPAWTDRILYSGQDLDLNRYQRAELLASDHRPVYAILRARIRTIDHVKRGALRKSLLADVASTSPLVEINARLAKLLAAHEPEGLPLPSDDSKSWWENGEELPIETQLSDATESTSNPFLVEESPTPAPAVAIRALRPPPPALTHNTNPTPPASATATASIPKRKLPPLASIPNSTSDGALIGLDDMTPDRVLPVVPPRPGNANVSLMDEEDDLSESKKWESIA